MVNLRLIDWEYEETSPSTGQHLERWTKRYDSYIIDVEHEYSASRSVVYFYIFKKKHKLDKQYIPHEPNQTVTTTERAKQAAEDRLQDILYDGFFLMW